jgi:ribose transport system substrate-binding protein
MCRTPAGRDRIRPGGRVVGHRSDRPTAAADPHPAPSYRVNYEGKKPMSRRRSMCLAATGAAVAALLSACSMSGPTGSDNSASGNAGSGDLKVGISSREITNDYNRDIIAGAQELFEDQGAKVTVTNGGGDPTKQANDITTLVNSGIDVLFIQLGDPAQLEPVVKAAVDKGVTVVTAGVGSLVPGAIADVGGDEEMMAEMSARTLFDEIGGAGDVYAFWVPGAPLLETRLAALERVAKEFPDVTIHREPTDFSPATVQSQMQTLLTAHSDKGSIAGVWGAYDQMASGAVQAVQSQGRDEIKVVSIDGDRATFNMLFAKGSPFVATVVQNAQLIGQLAAQAALDTLDGKPVGETQTSAWIANRHNGVAAAEERYGSGIWDEIGLDAEEIAAEWPQDGQVDVVQPGAN